MKVSIIVPSYIPNQNVEFLNKEFLLSLSRKTKRSDYQLVIVDNGSCFGVDEMKQAADIYIRKDYAMGYARAVNLGVAMSDHDLLVVINNDIEILQKDWLSKMREAYLDVGGLLSPQDDADKKNEYYPDESWYSMFMLSRRVWQKVGYLDEFLNFRFRDQDYSIRLKKAGYFVGRTGLVQVRRAHSATHNTINRNEDPEERLEMIRRHGAATLSEWLSQQ